MNMNRQDTGHFSMPKPNPLADLAAKLVQILRGRRERGEQQPITIAQLAAQVEPRADVQDVLKAFKRKPFAEQLLTVRNDPSSPVALSEDAERLAASPAVLDFVLGQMYQPKKELHPLPRVVAKVEKRLQPLFEAVLTQKIAENALPSLAGVLMVKGKPCLYLKAFPPARKPEIVLAETLLQALHQQQAAGTYPLPLRQLIARAQAEAAPELAKAVAHNTFQEHAVIAAKKNPDAPVALAEDIPQLAESATLLEFALGLLSTEKKPLHPVAKVVAKVDARLRESFAAAVQRRLDAGTLPPSVAATRIKDVPHLCLRAYLPKIAPEVELAAKLLQTLENQRHSDDYPLPLAQLIQKTEAHANAELVAKALAARNIKAHVLFALPGHPQTPVALSDDVDRLAEWPGLLEVLLANVCTADNQAAGAADLVKKVHKHLRKPFAAALDRKIEEATLPATVGCLYIKAKPYLFLVRTVGAKPGAVVTTEESKPAPPVDFAARFHAAFERLDEQNGSHNFVSLVDLRRLVPVERSGFDEGLRQLRQTGQYTLSSAEGRHGITPAEQEGGINEQGTLLLYVSRRRQ
jgi:hypothetical protein